MHPAVPPVFRRKKPTLCRRITVPCRIKLLKHSFDMLRREMHPLPGIRRFQPCQRSLEYLFTDLLTSSSHDAILYHNFSFFSIPFLKKEVQKREKHIENKKIMCYNEENEIYTCINIIKGGFSDVKI